MNRNIGTAALCACLLASMGMRGLHAQTVDPTATSNEVFANPTIITDPTGGDTGLTDPAVLHIGPGPSSTCATGGTTASGPCQFLYGSNTEVNGVQGTSLDIYFNTSGGAQGPLVNPILLILGVPNYAAGNILGTNPVLAGQYYPNYSSPSSTPQAGITLSAAPTSALGVYGLKTTSNFQTDMYCADPTKSCGKTDAYSALKLVGNASDSFANWAGADVYMNPSLAPIKDFGLYVFAFTLPPSSSTFDGFDGGDLLSFQLNVPLGTFAIAYGQDCGGSSGPSCRVNGGHAYTTPFTESGLVLRNSGGTDTGSPVPEPSSIILLGTVLLSGVWVVRRKRAAL